MSVNNNPMNSAMGQVGYFKKEAFKAHMEGEGGEPIKFKVLDPKEVGLLKFEEIIIALLTPSQEIALMSEFLEESYAELANRDISFVKEDTGEVLKGRVRETTAEENEGLKEIGKLMGAKDERSTSQVKQEKEGSLSEHHVTSHSTEVMKLEIKSAFSSLAESASRMRQLMAAATEPKLDEQVAHEKKLHQETLEKVVEVSIEQKLAANTENIEKINKDEETKKQ